MDGIYFGLRTIVHFEVLDANPFTMVTRTFVVEHSFDAVILCFVFLVFMGGSEGKATWSMR